MANAGPDTGGSQFFINLVNNNFLDPNYPVFGEVISGFDIVQIIGLVPTSRDDWPLTDVVMDSLRVTTVGPHVGISETESEAFEINVFPNPTKELITIHVGNNTVVESNYSLNNSVIMTEEA